MKKNKQYYFTLKGFFKRAKLEFLYYTKRPWSLDDVGQFWDTVQDYDVINSEIYPYYRRFTNSYELASYYIDNNNSYDVLDIQSRSGNGVVFWNNKINIRRATCIDFSDYLISLAKKKLDKENIKNKILKIAGFPIPLIDNSFNLIFCYETVEHVYEYEDLISELSRLVSSDGIIILTCPAISWEWVHWLSALININHSEGPHRFLRRRVLLNSFKKSNLKILEENSTILLPFNNKVSISLDKFFEKWLPTFIKRLLMLRRTFILKK